MRVRGTFPFPTIPVVALKSSRAPGAAQLRPSSSGPEYELPGELAAPSCVNLQLSPLVSAGAVGGTVLPVAVQLAHTPEYIPSIFSLWEGSYNASRKCHEWRLYPENTEKVRVLVSACLSAPGGAGPSAMDFSGDAPGAGAAATEMCVTIADGFPGVYGLVFSVDGVPALPLKLVLAGSRVASVVVIRGAAASAASPPGTLNAGMLVPVQPQVKFLDAAGAPVAGYQAIAFVAPDSTQGILLDVAPVGRNVLDTRISNPSDASGVATFEGLVVFDAVDGCYQLAFAAPYDPLLGANPVFGVQSAPLCVRAENRVRVQVRLLVRVGVARERSV